MYVCIDYQRNITKTSKIDELVVLFFRWFYFIDDKKKYILLYYYSTTLRRHKYLRETTTNSMDIKSIQYNMHTSGYFINIIITISTTDTRALEFANLSFDLPCVRFCHF